MATPFSIPRFLAVGLLFSVLSQAQVLTKIADIRNLSPEDAAKGMPVEVEATVLIYPGGNGPMVVSDGTGIWCAIREFHGRGGSIEGIGQADRVLIRGVANKGHSAPVIIPTSIVKIGQSALPPAKNVSLPDFHSGTLDSQWVSLEGVIQEVGEVDSSGIKTVNMNLSLPGGKTKVILLPPFDIDQTKLVDAVVRVEGACISLFNNRADVLEGILYAQGKQSIRIVKPAPTDPFSAPLSELTELRKFSPIPLHRHRERFIATVTSSRPGAYFHVIQGKRAMKVYSSSKDSLAPGDVVECVGFVEIESRYPVVRESLFRKIGEIPPPAPVSTTVPDILESARRLGSIEYPDMHDHLVALKGTLTRIEENFAEGTKLYLDSDNRLVMASLPPMGEPEDISDIRVGSVLELTGIATIEYTSPSNLRNDRNPDGVRLDLRGIGDVRVMQRASWWDSQRLLAALSSVLILLVLSVSLNEILRRRVADRGAQLAESIRSRRDLEVEAEVTLRERERLSADLHDTLEQTLAGVALQIEATRTAPTRERAERNLGIAERMLVQSREEVRRSVWSLRTPALENHFLREALEQICPAIFEGTEIHAVVDGTGDEEALRPIIAENLLLLAKECVTNAAKHASPGNIRISVDYSRSDVTLTVADDGCGFDFEKAPRSHDGHFGLSGMMQRARKIGGDIRFDTKPGKGTRVTIQVPDAILR